MGLAIISKLAFAMGGKVVVQSEVGKGSVFEAFVAVQLAPDMNIPEVTTNIATSSTHSETPSIDPLFRPPTVPQIPIQARTDSPTSSATTPVAAGVTSNVQPSPLDSSSRTVPSPSSSATGRRSCGAKPKQSFPDGLSHVLVVDDNDMNRKILKRMLAQMNLPHLEARHGREAVEVMFKTRNRTGLTEDPQVAMVLMDLSMPIMDGFEATESIRSYSDFENLPIIALTAAAVAEGREKCNKVGISEYQTKPIKRDQLYTICQRHLLPQRKESNMNSQEPRSIEDLLV